MDITRKRLLPGVDLENQALTSMPDTVRLLAWSLRLLTDSKGRAFLHPWQIRELTWPNQSRPRPTPAETETMLLELDQISYLTIYPHPDDSTLTLFQINRFGVDPSKGPASELPPPPKPSAPTSTAPGRDPASETPELARRDPPSMYSSREWRISTPADPSSPVTKGLREEATRSASAPPASCDLENPRNHADLHTFRKVVVGREGERERGWEEEAAAPHSDSEPLEDPVSSPRSHPSTESRSRDSPHPAPGPAAGIRLSPSRFCSLHRGGPPEGEPCPDCGTARGRAERHLELRTVRRQALQIPDPGLREMTVRGIDAELRALEEAAAAAGRPRMAPQTLPGMEYTASPGLVDSPDDGAEFDQKPF